MVLHATEGGLFLRSHRPFAFAYLLKEGYWDKLVDTLPQGILRRVKHQMLILEGLFRSSDLGDDRSEKGLLEYLKKALNGKTYDDVVALTGKWKLCSLSGPAPAVKVDACRRSRIPLHQLVHYKERSCFWVCFPRRTSPLRSCWGKAV